MPTARDERSRTVDPARDTCMRVRDAAMNDPGGQDGAGDAGARRPGGGSRVDARPPTAEPAWVRRLLIATALAFLGLFLFVPLVAVFAEAFAKGAKVYIAAITDPDALAAIRLTLL